MGLSTNLVQLRGPRISLELLDRRHLPKRVDFLNDPEVQTTLSFDFPTSLSKTEFWYSKIALSNDRVDFAFIENDSRHIIGFGGLIDINRRIGKAELYIFIGDKSYWGSGIGRDGYKLLVNYGFAELRLRRLYLYQLADNERAIQATSKLGWSTEGLLRQDILSHGQLKDRYIASLLREEWSSIDCYSIS